MSDGSTRRVLTFRQLSEYSGIPLRTLYVLAANKSETAFPAYRAGRKWCADLEQVMLWLLDRHQRGDDMGLVARRLRRRNFRKKQALLN